MDNNTTIGLDTSPAVRAMAQLEAASKSLASSLAALNAASPQRMTAEMAAVGVSMADMTATLRKNIDVIKAELGAGAKAAGAAVGKGMSDGLKGSGEDAVRTAKELRQLVQSEYEKLTATTQLSAAQLQTFKVQGASLTPLDRAEMDRVKQRGASAGKFTEDDVRSLLGMPDRDSMKTFAASLKSQMLEDIKAGQQTDRLRAASAYRMTEDDVRSLLGMPDRGSMKSFAASLKAQMVEDVRASDQTSRLRAASAGRVTEDDIRALLGMPDRGAMKSFAASLKAQMLEDVLASEQVSRFRAASASRMTEDDIRSLLGMPDRGVMKSFASSLKAQMLEDVRATEQTGRLRAASASRMTEDDVRSLLGMPDRGAMKSFAASLKAQMLEDVRSSEQTNRLRAASASRMTEDDVRSLLGMPDRGTMKSFAASLKAQMMEDVRSANLTSTWRAKSATPMNEEDTRALLGMPARAEMVSFSAALKAQMMADAASQSAATSAARGADRVTARAETQALSEANKELARSMNTAHSAARGLASGFGAMWLTWGQIAPLLAGAAISNMFVSAVRSGAEFENTLTAIQSLTGATAGDMQRLSAAAKELGANSQYGPNEVAKAMKALALAGLDAEKQLKSLKPTLDFSTVAELPMEKAAESLIAITTAFGYSADAVSTVGDVVAKAAAVSMSSVSDMTEAFRVASTVAQQFRVSIEDSSAILALLSQIGIRGSAAGTAMRNMYNELMGTSKEARKVLQDNLKVDIFDKNGVKPLVTIIEDLGKALNKYDFGSQLRILEKIGNERGGKAISATLTAAATEAEKSGRDIVSVLDDVRAKLQDAPGFVAIAAAGMAASAQNQLKSMANALETTLVKAFEQATPAIQSFAITLRSAFNSPGFIQGVTGVVTSIAAFGEALASNLDVLTAVAVGVGTGVTALTAFRFATHAATVVLPALGAAIGTVRLALGGAAISLGAVGAALGPLGAAIAVVAGVWAMFGRDASDSSKKAEQAESLRITATLQGLAAEEARLKEAIRLKRSSTDETVAAARVETEALLSGIALSNARAAAADQESVAKLRATRASIADHPGFPEQHRERALANADAQIRAQEELNRENERMRGEDYNGAKAQLERVRALARENANLDKAKVEAARSKIPTGSQKFNPDEVIPRGSVRGPLDDLQRTTQGVTEAFALAAAEEDRVAKDKIAKLNFSYNLGLKSYKDTEEAKDEIQKEHLRARSNLNALEIAQLEAAQQEATERARRANNERPGSVSEESVAAMRDAWQTKINQLRADERKIADDISRADETAAVRRFQDLREAQKAASDRTLAINNEVKALEEEAAFKKSLLGMSKMEVQVAEAERKATLDARKDELALVKQIAKYREGGDPEALKNAEKQLADLRAATEARVKAAGKSARDVFKDALDAKADPLKGMKDGLDDYLDKVNDVAGAMKGTMTRAFQGMEDALVEFATTGKLNFKSLAQSIISDLIRIQIQQSITKPLAQAMGKGNILSTIAGFFGFENGGVMSAQGSMPLRAYSSGGVANSPQLALYGEGRMPEAYVPLPDGRSIPVTMKGGAQPAGANVTVNVIESPREAGTQQRRTDSNGNEVIDVFVARIKAEVAGDIARGSGPVSAALQGTYGLNRVAGAY